MKRRPSYRQVRLAVGPRVESIRAMRPHIEPLLAAGHTWSEIGQAIERHLRQDALGQQAASDIAEERQPPEQCEAGR